MSCRSFDSRLATGSILLGTLADNALAEAQSSQSGGRVLISIHRLHWRVSRMKHEFHVSPVVPPIRTLGSEEGNAPPAARPNLVSTWSQGASFTASSAKSGNGITRKWLRRRRISALGGGSDMARRPIERQLLAARRPMSTHRRSRVTSRRAVLEEASAAQTIFGRSGNARPAGPPCRTPHNNKDQPPGPEPSPVRR